MRFHGTTKIVAYHDHVICVNQHHGYTSIPVYRFSAQDGTMRLLTHAGTVDDAKQYIRSSVGARNPYSARPGENDIPTEKIVRKPVTGEEETRPVKRKRNPSTWKKRFRSKAAMLRHMKRMRRLSKKALRRGRR